jgi:hypothetical protein
MLVNNPSVAQIVTPQAINNFKSKLQDRDAASPGKFSRASNSELSPKGEDLEN